MQAHPLMVVFNNTDYLVSVTIYLSNYGLQNSNGETSSYIAYTVTNNIPPR